MRVFMLSLGTRGDVELFVMLGRQLHSRGHQVVLGTSAFYVDRVEGAGLEWVRIGNGSQQELLSLLQSLAAIPDKRERVFAYAKRWLRPQLAAAKGQIQAMGNRADYFINNLKIVLKRDQQIFPGAVVTTDPPGNIDDLAKYATRLIKNEGLILELVAMNKRLLDPEDRWGEPYRFTGFWHEAPQPWDPPPPLREFMDSGPPPVVLTMGSMVMFDPEKLVQDVVDALQLAGQRGVILASWSGIACVSVARDSIYCADEIPYDWLFPRSSCVIHHGGCGTVAAVLRAGKPSILLPRISSQEHFANILGRERLLAGVFDTEAMKPAELAEAISNAITDEQCHASAKAWQRTVAEDGGLPQAADLIEAHWHELTHGKLHAGG